MMIFATAENRIVQKNIVIAIGEEKFAELNATAQIAIIQPIIQTIKKIPNLNRKRN